MAKALSITRRLTVEPGAWLVLLCWLGSLRGGTSLSLPTGLKSRTHSWTIRNSAFLGALAIIIGVAAGPFAQQIVHFYDAEYVDIARTAWLSRADTIAALGPKMDSSSKIPSSPHFDTITDSWVNLPAWTPDLVFKSNAVTALFLPTQEVLSQPQFNCPTGNCTWAPFTTLGFRPTCADLSSQLNRTCKPVNNQTTVQSCTVAFPGGDDALSLWYIADPDYPGSSTYMVVNSTDAMNATALTNITWQTKIYQSIRAVVPPFQLGGGQDPNEFNNGNHLLQNNTRFIGSECALSPCVLRLKASVSRGVYTEEILDTWTEFEYNYPGPIVLSPPWAEGKNFTLIAEWLQAITYSPGPDLFGGQMMGSAFTYDSNQAIRITDIPSVGSSSRENDALQAVFYANFNGTTCPTPDDNFACAFRSLSAAMTKSVRDAGLLKNGTQEPYVVEGTTNAMGIFIRIEWPWFALPVMIWVLSLVTLLTAMLKSRTVPLWRDSVLPLVLLSGERQAVGGVTEAELSIRAEEVKVQLVEDEQKRLKILVEHE